jgi:hypothetical protein
VYHHAYVVVSLEGDAFAKGRHAATLPWWIMTPEQGCISRRPTAEILLRGGFAFATSLDESLQGYLSQAGVEWRLLAEPERLEAEAAWRWLYGKAFRGRPRLRRGAKAEYEYQSQVCVHYLILPLPAGISGLPMRRYGRATAAYECRGPLIALGTFCDAEFFINPPDLAWSMIHTHEDHGFGGPYFIRAEWITDVGG